MFSREVLVIVGGLGRTCIAMKVEAKLDGSWEAALSPGDATWDSFSSVGGFVVFTGILWQLTILVGEDSCTIKHQT